jgi:hypothetical protein
MRARALAVLTGVLGAMLLFANLAAADEPEIIDNPPAIAAGELGSSSLSYEGGNVQIRAEVVDDGGTSMVYATVYGSDGSWQSFQLFEGYTNNYFGTLEVPANYEESSRSYQVEIQAWDSANNYVSTTIGSVEVEGRPQFDEPPYVSEGSLTPQFLPAEGGTVTIAADAYDTRSLSAVYATVVALPGGASTEVPLNGVSSSHFEGTFTAPANSGPLAAEYIVEVVAEDDIGQQGRLSPGTIVVEPPPPLPSAGLLKASPSDRSFGSVRLGSKTQRFVFVSNENRRGGASLSATARLAGSLAFSFPGAPPEGIHFTLRPGEKRKLSVDFAPTTTGPHAAVLQIIRDDGGQPGFGVELSGQAVAKR